MDIHELHKIISNFFKCEVSQTQGFSNIRLVGSTPPREVVIGTWFVDHLGEFSEEEIVTLLTGMVENNDWYVNPNDAPAVRDIHVLCLDEHNVIKYLNPVSR